MNAVFTWEHLLVFFSGSTAIGVIAHAVATFPTPKNPYGQWFLGIIKFIVGQRVSAINSINGLQTEVTGVTDEQKNALANGSVMRVYKTGTILRPVENLEKED